MTSVTIPPVTPRRPLGGTAVTFRHIPQQIQGITGTLIIQDIHTVEETLLDLPALVGEDAVMILNICLQPEPEIEVAETPEVRVVLDLLPPEMPVAIIGH